jgi:KEOPS complex subunit Pcc1
VTPSSHEATLIFNYETPENSRLVERAIEGELNEIDGNRTQATLTRDSRSISIRVTADDLVALRAGLNTWSTLVEVAESTGDVVGQ